MIDFINQNASTIIALFTGGTLLTTAASVVKVFSQKRLNKSFDAFNLAANTSSNASTVLSKAVNTVNDLSVDVIKLVTELKSEIEKLNVDGILAELRDGLKELETVKLALDYKDKLIEAYTKDIADIKTKLAKISGESGFLE